MRATVFCHTNGQPSSSVAFSNAPVGLSTVSVGDALCHICQALQRMIQGTGFFFFCIRQLNGFFHRRC